MIWSAIIIGYFLICLSIILFVPVVRKDWKSGMEGIRRDLSHTKRSLLQEIFLILLLAMVLTIYVLIIPYSLSIIMRDGKRRNSVDKVDLWKYLYFSKMAGGGVITCLKCGYMENITSYIHGYKIEYEGMQCQSCGKFSAIKIEDNKKTICSCGGSLQRDKPLFCPKCNSIKLNYKMKYIT